MNEIEDIKNHVLALNHKLNGVLKFIDTLKNNNERINEVLNLIHNMTHEKSRENNVIFNVMYPDIIRRLTNIELKSEKEKEKEKNNLRIMW